jgi:hypothetical protein
MYAEELKGSIILNIDNVKAVDVETVARIMSKKEESQRVNVQMITKSGQLLRIIL